MTEAKHTFEFEAGVTNAIPASELNFSFPEKHKKLFEKYIVVQDFDEAEVTRVLKKIDILFKLHPDLGDSVLLATNTAKENYWFICFSIVPRQKMLDCMLILNGCKGYWNHLKRLGRNTIRLTLRKRSQKTQKVILIKNWKRKSSLPNSFEHAKLFEDWIGTGLTFKRNKSKKMGIEVVAFE